MKHVRDDTVQAYPLSLDYEIAARAGVGKSDISLDEAIRQTLSNQNLQYEAIRKENITLDIAFSFLPTTASAIGLTGLWSDYDFLRRIFFTPNLRNKFRGKFRQDDFSDFGVVATAMHQISSSRQFFHRNPKSNRQGKDVKPSGLYYFLTKQGKVYSSWLDTTKQDAMSMAAGSPTYAARVEFRCSAEHISNIHSKMMEPRTM
ncbi:hypothetical protein [Parasitella parasitica]|uniref:Uncharacterized protein n=1 Tax=Parasitella parasitica TaxID=35722 RepID=A0A0B7N224_9FUNG|nr:hypothetical protein [Parasitella parasitica]